MQPAKWCSVPEDLQVMPFNLRIMEMLGLWGHRDQIYRFALAVFIAIIVILFPKAVLGIGSSDVTAICKGMAEFIFEAGILITVAVLAFKRTKFAKVIHGLEEVFRDVTAGEESKDYYDMIKRHNWKIRKVFNFFVIYCGYGPFAYCLPSVLISHWRFWNNVNPLVLVLPMEQEFYGLQIRTNFGHYHIFVSLSMVAYCVCALCSFITTTCFLVKYSTFTYQLVVAKIKKLSQPISNDREGSQVKFCDLVEVVELHRKACEITEQVEEICQIPVALEFLTCVIFWCLNMIYISNNIDLNLVNVLIIFWLTMLQVFGYSYLGSELAEEAAAVGNAVYDLPWYEHSEEMQRHYRLMIQRSQQPTGITGLKFFVVNRITFADVIQMSYSYYLILKDILNK